jgi:hypothetical protein
MCWADPGSASGRRHRRVTRRELKGLEVDKPAPHPAKLWTKKLAHLVVAWHRPGGAAPPRQHRSDGDMILAAHA